MVHRRMAAAVADPAHRIESRSRPPDLALYWLSLMAGRLVSAAILPRVRHGRLLLGSVAAALFGCVILYFTDNGFGAATGVLFLGVGYASIYPLVSEAIGRRFPYYHPGFFNGIFSFALVGGLLAPATLGYAASLLGCGRGGGHSAGRHLHGDGADPADLAGIEGDRKMRRPGSWPPGCSLARP